VRVLGQEGGNRNERPEPNSCVEKSRQSVARRGVKRESCGGELAVGWPRMQGKECYKKKTNPLMSSSEAKASNRDPTSPEIPQGPTVKIVNTTVPEKKKEEIKWRKRSKSGTGRLESEGKREQDR